MALNRLGDLKKELQSLRYRTCRWRDPQHLWMEKGLKSVANVARRDITEFLELAPGYPLFPKFSNIPW